MKKIKVPNIKSMDKNEIQDWISKNKLSKTRVITVYNENVEENEVIDYSFSGCDEDNFTRACTLKINVSKGPAPAGKITVEDFEKKLYESVETWAKSKKINLVKVEQYSDIIDKGYVISQSVPSGKTIDEGADFVVTVSLGKAITVPNFIGWDKENIIKWARKNAVSLDPEGGHDNDGRFEYDFSVEPVGSCIKQYPAPNTILKDGEAYVHIWLSKGHPNMEQFTGNTLDDLNKWVREVNIDSGNVDVVVETQLSEKHSPGEIIEISNSVMCNGTIYVTVSEGSNLFVTDLPQTKTTNIEDVRNWLSTSNIKNFEFKYENNDSIDNGHLIKIIRSDTGKELKENTYLPETVTVIFIFCEK